MNRRKPQDSFIAIKLLLKGRSLYFLRKDMDTCTYWFCFKINYKTKEVLRIRCSFVFERDKGLANPHCQNLLKLMQEMCRS